jgi:hypothetical protein
MPSERARWVFSRDNALCEIALSRLPSGPYPALTGRFARASLKLRTGALGRGMLAQPFWGSYRGRMGEEPKPSPAPWRPLARLLRALGGLGANRGSAGWEWTATGPIRRTSSASRSSCLRGWQRRPRSSQPRPSSSCAANVREVIARKRALSTCNVGNLTNSVG